ncbi:ABC transporter substrate-binding protein [Neomegalonema sp.]|uniref:ABC transporter substrate-binding protein n=1 Tax=Neomegalonema sp. TaxID=2039713 RepID=UPI00262BEF96|nr:ABC transporter substrate-binding protein [Neomegalonema sp.]MDD2868313.1 ABC transporter substrate-binding protein [Neomegalonema sp.]
MTRTIFGAFALSLGFVGAASSAELRMSWWGGDGRHVATQEALKYCGGKLGHSVKPEFAGFEGYLERLSTQLAGRTEADILQVDWPWLHQFSRDGSGFADLRELADSIDLDQWNEGQLAPVTLNGKLNGAPVSVTGAIPFFNVEAFRRHGLDLPKTWEDLAAAARVMNPEGAWPYDATKVILMFTIESLTAQASGLEFVDPETGEIAWTKEDLVKALNHYRWMVDQGILRPWRTAAAVGNVEVFDDPAWGEGRVGGTLFWDSTYSKFNDPIREGHLEPVPPMRIEGAKTDGLYKKPSMVFAVSRNSRDPKAAAQVIDCLLNDPEAIRILGVSRGLPASAVARRTLEEAGQLGAANVEAARIVAEATGPAMSPLIEHPAVQEVFLTNIEEFAYGRVTAEEAADRILSDLRRALRRL